MNEQESTAFTEKILKNIMHNCSENSKELFCLTFYFEDKSKMTIASSYENTKIVVYHEKDGNVGITINNQHISLKRVVDVVKKIGYDNKSFLD